MGTRGAEVVAAASAQSRPAGATGCGGFGFSPLTRPPYDNLVEGGIGVICSDTDNPDNYEAWPAAAATAAEDSYFGEFWTHFGVQCWNWPGVAPDEYTGPFTASTANTVLIASPTYDPATRYEGAIALRGLLPNSSLLTVEGWGHTTLFLSACADAAISAYFITGVAPADGTVCTQDFSPFLAAAAPMDPATEAAVVRAQRRSEVMDEIAIRPGR